MKTIFSTTMRVGKGTVFVVGLAVILAAMMGAASMALAANGKPFILGKNNVARAISTLTKQGPGPALRLIVRPGQPPMAVNSQVKVANLNADRVDGKDSTDFLSGRVLTVQNQTGNIPGPAGGSPADVTVSCPAGQKAIGGGAGWIIPNFQDGNVATSFNTPTTASIPIPATAGTDNHTGWRAHGRNLSGAERILRVYAVCVPQTP